MSVKMPCAVRRLIPYPHCIMTKDNSLAVKRYFCEIVEPGKLLNQFTRVFVVISGDPKYPLAANLLSKFRSSRFRPHTKIPKEVQNVVRLYGGVQAFNNRMIHLLNRFKRAIAVPNNVLVPQMKISSEPNVWHELSRLTWNPTQRKYRSAFGRPALADRWNCNNSLPV